MSLRVERGDFQTPPALAHAVMARLARTAPAPRTVLEPTCGKGAFLLAAAERFPEARLVGFDIEPAYVEEARAAVPAATIEVASCFELDWGERVGALPEGPLLVVGNPPWVTSATLGALASPNAPRKSNTDRARGIDARTGASNFDVSEWLGRALVAALAARSGPSRLAFLVKSAVARKLIARAARDGISFDAELCRIDARAHFGVAVDAVLVDLLLNGAKRRADIAIFDSLEAKRPARSLAREDGALVPDKAGYEATRGLEASAPVGWRSGIKHDCRDVFELTRIGDHYVDARGETVPLEADVVYPLLKGTDLARGVAAPRRFVVVSQRALGDVDLEARAPLAARYLASHADRLATRKSSIYRGRPAFAIFGVGDYSFAPWKVAISGLHKALSFRLVGPWEGRPIMFDDTCYFLPFEDEATARAAHEALSSEDAQRFFSARIFLEDKRPVTKKVLDRFALPVGLSPLPS